MRRIALDLIETRRTMVLATADAQAGPWAAPVYFVYAAPDFYFFSSPDARHITDGGHHQTTAAAIFADSDRWDRIRGLQMTGTLAPVTGAAKVRATAAYLARFPFAAPLLKKPAAAGGAVKTLASASLYRFRPSQVFVMDNRFGLGSRFAAML